VTIIAQKMELDCEYVVSIRKKEASAIKIAFEELRHVKIVQT